VALLFFVHIVFSGFQEMTVVLQSIESFLGNVPTGDLTLGAKKCTDIGHYCQVT